MRITSNQYLLVSPLGCVEMTRKRTRRAWSISCAILALLRRQGFCENVETVCYEVFREIVRQSRQFECQQLMVLAHQDVIERLPMRNPRPWAN